MNITPIINIRALLIWEYMSEKKISDISNSDDDIQNMKYSSFISGGASITKSGFNILYGSYDFRNNFDTVFLSSFNNFELYGKHLFTTYTVKDLIFLLMEKYKIDYETIVNKMTFQEINMLLK